MEMHLGGESPSEEEPVQLEGAVETAVLEAMVAVDVGEPDAEAVLAEPFLAEPVAEEPVVTEPVVAEPVVVEAEEEQAVEPSQSGGADFRSVTIQETKDRLVETEDGTESRV